MIVKRLVLLFGMMMLNELLKLLEYKAWANEINFHTLSLVSDDEIQKIRETHFKNIISTLNHIYVVDDIFKAHLLSKKHGYVSRNTESSPDFLDLWAKQKRIDLWYIEFISSLETEKLNDIIHFEYVGGGKGEMSIMEIVFHIVNHGTYHRGFVSDMMYQIPCKSPANDLTVYLRDVYRKR